MVEVERFLNQNAKAVAPRAYKTVMNVRVGRHWLSGGRWVSPEVLGKWLMPKLIVANSTYPMMQMTAVAPVMFASIRSGRLMT